VIQFYKSRILVLLFSLLLFGISAQASLKSEYFAAKDDLQVIENAQNVSRASYATIAERFYRIYSEDPKFWLADDSLYMCGKTYLKSYWRFNNEDDLKSALKYYRLLGANYDSKWAADSYLKSAYIYTTLSDYVSAKYMLQRVINKFPGSYSASEAKKRLAEIEKKFSDDHKIEINFSKEDPKDEIVSNVVSQSGDDNLPDASVIGSGSVLIKDIRYFSSKDYTRVVIDLNSDAKFEKHWLKADPEHGKPPRLFLDIFNSKISGDISRRIDIQDGLLDAIRWGIFKKGVTRVVLDSENVEDFTVFSLSNPERIVIDVSGSRLAKKSSGDGVSDSEVSSDTFAGVLGLKVRTIVIDPGHGGKDPGAVYHGIYEKDVVLNVGKYLRKMIKERTDLTVYMTRDTDIFIPLEERTAFANKKKADIFVSIHVNAARNRNARGVETYVLNVTDDKRALEVAALENKATKKSLSDLQGILKDIMLNSKLEESLILAQSVQDSLVAETKQKSLGVKQAPFYVLVGAQMPSILVEAGFLSNSAFAEKVKRSSYQKQIAEGIFEGILKYIEKYNGKS